MKYRHEYKYVIDARQEAILRVRIGGLLEPDRHAGETGSYLVRSAYFDDCLDSCLNDNLLGAEPRSKFRLRYYGNDPGTIRLEKKSKQKGMTQKDFARLMGKTETEVSRWLSGTHNMTLATLCKISIALGENLLEVPVNHSELAMA